MTDVAAALFPEDSLARVSMRMARSLDLDEVLAEITRGLVRDLGASLARIWLVRATEPRMLVLAASAGITERLDGTRSRVPFGSLKIGQIAESGAAVVTSELAEDPRFVDKPWIAENRLRAFAGYPLRYGEELLGVLAVFTPKAISDAERGRLELFVAQGSVAIKNAALFASVNELTRRLEAENRYLKEELHAWAPAGMVGRSAALTKALGEVDRVAQTSSTVLLQGETGTGKELFARAVHEKSPRKNGPLVKVNCGALVAGLVESELFGHEKGAFTGAVQRRVGRFELADHGTIFLDEISELPLEAQTKLLRVLQEHEIDRVGGTHPIRVDARVVVATNRDLGAEVKAGRFRSDLYYRLAVFPIAIPPLRDRRDDIPLLVDAFLARLGKRFGTPEKHIDEDALSYLQAYPWPGNVRELENVLERAVVLARGAAITMADLPELSAPEPAATAPVEGEAGLPLKDRVNGYEKSILVDALRLANGNQSEAARLLRTSRATLQYKLKVHGI